MQDMSQVHDNNNDLYQIEDVEEDEDEDKNKNQESLD
jgi:hypothetical protein